MFDFDLADEGDVRRSSDLYQPFFCGLASCAGLVLCECLLERADGENEL